MVFRIFADDVTAGVGGGAQRNAAVPTSWVWMPAIKDGVQGSAQLAELQVAVTLILDVPANK